MKKSVLFVDDESSILNAVKRLFRKSPHNIVTANDTGVALDLIHRTPFAVLISDYTMPSMTGAELLAKAKEIRPDMVRVILSGNNDQEATIKSLNLGAADKFLTKPWDDKELVQEIDNFIALWESKNYSSPEKKLLRQSSFIQKLNEKIESPEKNNFLAVYFGISDMEKLQQRIGVESIVSALQEIAPVADVEEAQKNIAIMDDNRYCAFLDLNEDASNAIELINQLKESFSASTTHKGQLIDISLDFGYWVVQENLVSSTEVIKCALTAYQHAIASESNEYVAYEPAMGERNRATQKIENGLPKALANNEFLLNYQVKINASKGTMHGMEALLRWNSPALGMIPPLDFIPVAERSNIIYEIGEWVLNEATRQYVEWFGTSSDHPVVSVNVSPRQLKDSAFANRIESILERHKINPASLELEITESVLMDDVDGCIEVLKKIKGYGITLSIDDFGTGYSSLSYLDKLPVDILKIDRSFIFPMLESNEKTELVRNLIKMAHDMKVEVVAEGVEESQQLELLKKFGCDVIQGFFYSPPVSAEEFAKLIDTYPASDNLLKSANF